jgi:hypothetical protein
MTRELLDIATKYTMGEEAMLANFSDKVKATTHLSGGDGGDDATTANRRRG